MTDDTYDTDSYDTSYDTGYDTTTYDEPMTGPQRSYLDNLARQAGEELPADLNKAEASEHIERLRDKTGAAEG